MRNPAYESKFFKNSVYPFCVNFGKITNFYAGFLSLFSHLYYTSPKAPILIFSISEFYLGKN